LSNRLSPDAEQQLGYAFECGGQSPLVHAVQPAHKAIRVALVERSVTGVDDPLVVPKTSPRENRRLKQLVTGYSGLKHFRVPN
jgi:hypothetical protein